MAQGMLDKGRFNFDRYKRYERGKGGGPDVSGNPYTGGYFDPRHRYGSPYGRPGSNRFQESGFGKHLAEQQPNAAFLRYAGQSGLPTKLDSPFGSFLSNQYGQMQADFEAARLGNPHLTFRAFLQRIGQPPKGGPDPAAGPGDPGALGRGAQRRANFADFMRNAYYASTPDVMGVAAGPGAARWEAFY